MIIMQQDEDSTLIQSDSIHGVSHNLPYLEEIKKGLNTQRATRTVQHYNDLLQ